MLTWIWNSIIAKPASPWDISGDRIDTLAMCLRRRGVCKDVRKIITQMVFFTQIEIGDGYTLHVNELGCDSILKHFPLTLWGSRASMVWENGKWKTAYQDRVALPFLILQLPCEICKLPVVFKHEFGFTKHHVHTTAHVCGHKHCIGLDTPAAYACGGCDAPLCKGHQHHLESMSYIPTHFCDYHTNASANGGSHTAGSSCD